MLNLAIAALVVLVASTLWLLLRPDLPVAAPDGLAAADTGDTDEGAAPLGHPEVRVADPHHPNDRPPSH